ncbi:hypothetical protein GKZ90_0011705 [Flavobacterium sp. MC2016-06]|uniref:hypothetical protein n=1 Tax=Flavobacterium sp. MC2016-06 TaxID=2676308 RepID=UPI0012BAADA5|nr:hypothetical protein [Flavobacterium sp. MC2016-06]MBU3862113.1 hypothetical protein [Flavobacterium sp. MC2016-06]
MSKSILKSSIVFLLILNILFPIVSYAQFDIVGKWKINNIIGYRDTGEYSLVKDKEPIYGHRLTFRLDGTFLSDESIECPDGCTVFTSGTYALLDDCHIRMIVEDVHFFGLYCGMQRRQKSEIIKDLGIFYIYKEENTIRLIPSNGILQDDKDKMLYTQMLNSFEWKMYDYVWNNTNGSTTEEIIKDCIDVKEQINLSNCKIVFPSKTPELGGLYILKENEDFHYVFYDSYHKRISFAYPKKNKS